MMTWAIVLLCAGLALIVAELMFPTLGLLGVMAALCLIGAIAMAFAEDKSTGMIFLAATTVLVPTVILVGFRLLPHTPFGKHLVQRGFSFVDGAAVDPRDKLLLDKEGEVEAPLRPAGTARMDGRRVDVMSRGEHIEAGARVRVIEVEGNRVVVARVPRES